METVSYSGQDSAIVRLRSTTVAQWGHAFICGLERPSAYKQYQKNTMTVIRHAKRAGKRLFRSVPSTTGRKQSVLLTNTNQDRIATGEDISGNGFVLRLARLFYKII